MTHSFYRDRKSKRENECDDFDHNVPSAKRLKMKNPTDTQTDNMFDGNCSFYATSKDFSDELRNKSQNFQNAAHNMDSGLLRDRFQCDITPAVVPCVPVELAALQQINLKYLPDLSAVENPHYYENNRLLFELNMERIRRTASQSVNTTSHQFSQ